MDQDVIELSQIIPHAQDVALLQPDVGQAGLVDEGRARSRLRERQLDPDELAFAQMPRHGNQVAAARTAELQHPAVFGIGRGEPE